MLEPLYVIGYPKSGTTWLARLLGDALDSRVGAVFPQQDGGCIAHEGDGRPGPWAVRQGHALPDEVSGRVVFMLRDTRDLIPSVAHHWRMSVKKTIDCMELGMWPLDFGTYEDYMRQWMAVPYPIVTTRYGELRADTPAELGRILAALGIRADAVRVRDAAARQEFAARRAWTEQHGDGLTYGKEFQLRFLRRGVAGSWRDELPREHWRRVWGLWGRLLMDLGYETGPEWMDT